MFVGEMGCWLVVGAFSIYRHFYPKAAPLLEGGYTAVNEAEDSESNPDTDSMPDQINNEPNGVIAKSLLPANVDSEDNRQPLSGWRILLLGLPACCDITGTTLMNVGLLFVAASIYQMTRGALVLFVGLFSVVFLHRRLYLYHWSALFIVVMGVGLVGLAGAIAPNPQAKPDPPATASALAMLLVRRAADEIQTAVQTPEAVQTVVGVLLIAFAQIFTATQFVVEEWILEHYAVEPLKMVGWEGIFGFGVTLLGMIVLHFAVGQTEAGRHGYFDMVEGWREITQNRAIAVSSVLIMISIGGYNFFGLSITRSVSATARSIIDTCRTLFIWIVSLGLGWESFKWLQIVGFAFLVYGTFVFNDIVRPPMRACAKDRREDKVRPEPLLQEDPIEHM